MCGIADRLALVPFSFCIISFTSHFPRTLYVIAHITGRPRTIANPIGYWFHVQVGMNIHMIIVCYKCVYMQV